MKAKIVWIFVIMVIGGTGCVQVKPIKVEPIHITMDVNIRIDRQLDEFFDFENKLKPSVAEPGDVSREPSPEVKP